MLILKFNDLENEYKVDFTQNSENIVTIHSVNGYLPVNTSGFILSREDASDRWDYSAYTTIYQKVDNFTYQYSNDGSVYVVPKIDVTVQAIWNDSDNAYGIRPEELTVEFLNNGKKSFDDVLKKKNNYTIVHKDRLSNRKFSINAPDLPIYEKAVDGTTVTYTINVPYPRPITLDDVAECVLNPDSPFKAFIYASYCENNTKNFYKDVPEEWQNKVKEVIEMDKFMVNEDGTCSLMPINMMYYNEVNK